MLISIDGTKKATWEETEGAKAQAKIWIGGEGKDENAAVIVVVAVTVVTVGVEVGLIKNVLNHQIVQDSFLRYSSVPESSGDE
ncbi:hypothetical protein FRC09_011395 [Ceratobasidium sp. 395]|nr:hypothetical protein FRC09_011395 [Ceratobasidium sp. 395]